MKRALLLVPVLSLGITTFPAAVGASPVPAALPAQAIHQLELTGVGTTTYPSFTPDITRYGVRTTADTLGTVTVTASTDDPAGRVFVDGALATGPVEVTGLDVGDEVSVIFKDPGTPAQHHSLIYLPVGFPVLAATGSPTGTDSTLMTLNPFGGNPDRWMVALDGNAVPRAVRRYTGNRHDLKRLDNGHYSVSQNVALPAGNVILELDDDFQEIERRSTDGLQNTDFHDSLLLPDGSRVLMAYEPNGVTGNYDSVFQEIDPSGELAFEWSTGDHVDLATERVGLGTDYSHMNSIQRMSDGDYLVSMRHLSSVFKIAREARPGFAEGDIVWRLGGRLSDFDLTSDPLGGPCAQHTATETAPGRILMFDNGSDNRLCVDPADPAGPATDRLLSRVVEYALDETDPDNPVATVVDEYAPPGGRFVPFAGSSERLDNGNTLIGWTNHPDGIATELDADFEPIWDMTASAGFGSYRAHRGETPDVLAPEVTLSTPTDGATYAYGAQVIAAYGCTDGGGSSLVECSGPAEEGSTIDTSAPGEHTFTVTAEDGDGNVTTTSRSYVVGPAPVVVPTPSPTPPPAPTVPPVPTETPTVAPTPAVDHDAGLGVRRGARARLTAGSPRAKAVVVLRNDGTVADRFTLRGPRSSRTVRVRYKLGGDNVTSAVRRGRLTTASLEPGERVVLKVLLTRRVAADGRRTLRVRARSVGDEARQDAVRIRVRTR